MSRFENVADVSFIDDITVAGLKEMALSEYRSAYTEITGKTTIISDEHKAELYAVAQILYQTAESINKKAKQNLSKYSEGNYLDNIGLRDGLYRKQAENSVTTIEFKLSSALENTIAIPAGTRITSPARTIYFVTNHYAEIPPGFIAVEVQCTSLTGGTAANDFDIGELNVLVDPIAYISEVSNTEKPIGGTDQETDDEFAERIFNARNKFSTTGSENAYIYYTKSYSTLIDDVDVQNPSDAEIKIYILMKNREAATEAFIAGLTDYLYDKNTKPLTDHITVENVDYVDYQIDVEYKICDVNASHVAEIQSEVEAAIESYKSWQCAKIGRDIDSQELLSLLKTASAKGIVIKQPQSTTILKNQIANCTDVKITYTGLQEE